MRSPVHRLAPLVVAVATLAAACGGEDAPEASPAEVREFRAAVEGLCQTANTLRQGDVSAAVRTFGDRTHMYLHDLIDRVEPRDRAAATELLEAKHRMEVALKNPDFYGQEETAERFTDLHNSMVRAGGMLGLPEVGCGA